MPLRGTQARNLIRRLLDAGLTAFGGHARREMRKDGLSDVDAVNVLRGGTVDEPEFENGAWRYRVRTPRMAFVVEIEPDVDVLPPEGDSVDEMRVFVVTAMRTQR